MLCWITKCGMRIGWPGIVSLYAWNWFPLIVHTDQCLKQFWCQSKHVFWPYQHIYVLMVIQLSSLTLRSQQVQILGETNHHSWGFSGFPPSHQTKGPWSMWYHFCHGVISATDKYVMSLQNKYSSVKSVSCIGNNFLSLFHDICKLYRTLFHVIPFLSLSFMFWSTLCHEISMDQNLLLYINRNSSSYTTRTSFYGRAIL